MMTTMNIDDFEVRAMAYGANIHLWPEEDRAAATALLSESPAAQTMLDEARALDATLDLWEAPQPSDALLSRVLADAGTVAGETSHNAPAASTVRPAQEGWLTTLLGSLGLMRPGMALAACLAFGFVMGTTLEQDILSTTTTPAPVVMAEDMGVIDFAFAMEDDADLLLGSEALL